MRTPCAVLRAAVTLCAAGLSAQGNVEKLVADLDHANASRRSAAHRALSRDRPNAALGQLVRVLPAFSTRGQDLGVLVLAKYPVKRALSALRKLTRADDKQLVALCGIALMKAGRTSGAAAWIRAGLSDPSAAPADRSTILRRLAGIDDPGVLDAVRDLLAPGCNPSVFYLALDHLWKQGDVEVDAVVRGLATNAKLGAHHRRLCAAFLAARNAADAPAQLAPLLAALRKPAALHVHLWTFLQRAYTAPRSVIAAVIEHVKVTENATSMQRALVVLRHVDDSGAVPALRRRMKQKDVKIAEAALRGLADAGALDADDLRELLASAPPRIRLTAADTLRRMDDHTGLETVLQLVAEPGAHSAQAVTVLGGFRVNAAVPPLLAALSDADGKVRAAAVRSLGAVLRGLFPYRRFDLASTGYAANAKPAARQAAIAKLETWWHTNRDRDW